MMRVCVQWGFMWFYVVLLSKGMIVDKKAWKLHGNAEDHFD